MNDILIPVTSKGTVNFLEGLITGAATAINAIPAGNLAVGSRRFYIRAISVLAMEKIGPAFYFFASAAPATVDVDTDRWISQFTFSAGMGQQIGGAGLWRYYVDGLAIPYYMDGSGNSQSPPTLNVSMENDAVLAKSAGAPGAIACTFWLQQMQTP